jgi:hypothetical protein
MDKAKKSQAEKLQIRLDKLLQVREKKQSAFEKSKQELNAVSKEVEGVKLKLFEILQSGSDDIVFSNWAKRKIGEKSENGKTANSEKAVLHNQQSQSGQNHSLEDNDTNPF